MSEIPLKMPPRAFTRSDHHRCRLSATYLLFLDVDNSDVGTLKNFRPSFFSIRFSFIFPFCIQMFEDGVPSIQPEEEGRIKPFDVAELLETAVFGPPSTETSDPEE